MADSENIKNFKARAKSDHMDKIRHHSEGDDDFHSDAAMIRAAIAQHEKADHPRTKLTKIKFRASGGAAEAEGESAAKRNDRPRRAAGGGTKSSSGAKGDGKHGARVNVIIAPQHPPGMGGGMGMPVPGGALAGPARPPGPPVPPPAPPMPPPGGMPPRPMPVMMPPGGGAGPLPPMMPPRKAGGRVNRASGGATGVMPAEEKSDNQDGEGREEQRKGVSADKRMKEQMGPYAKGGRAGRAAGGGLEDQAPRNRGMGSAMRDADDEDRRQWTPPSPPGSSDMADGKKRGGAVKKRAAGGGITEDLEDKTPTGKGVGEDGAGSGLGRLAKVRRYGDASTKGEEV